MSNNFLLVFKGYLTQNMNPSLGLSNGTPVIYHSLTLSPLEDMHSVMERMVNNDGSDIFLKFQPTYIHVATWSQATRQNILSATMLW